MANAIINGTCRVCYDFHPKGDWPWEKFPVPVYWSLPNDGAGFTCSDCRQKKSHKDVLLTQLSCGARSVMCKDCIDSTWLTLAKDMGTFNV